MTEFIEDQRLIELSFIQKTLCKKQNTKYRIPLSYTVPFQQSPYATHIN